MPFAAVALIFRFLALSWMPPPVEWSPNFAVEPATVALVFKTIEPLSP